MLLPCKTAGQKVDDLEHFWTKISLTEGSRRAPCVTTGQYSIGQAEQYWPAKKRKLLVCAKPATHSPFEQTGDRNV